MQTKMSQLLEWMQEQGLQPEIVSFCDPSVSWLDYTLIIPTPGLVYLDFYQPVMQVRRRMMGRRMMGRRMMGMGLIIMLCSGLRC